MLQTQKNRTTHGYAWQIPPMIKPNKSINDCDFSTYAVDNDNYCGFFTECPDECIQKAKEESIDNWSYIFNDANDTKKENCFLFNYITTKPSKIKNNLAVSNNEINKVKEYTSY